MIHPRIEKSKSVVVFFSSYLLISLIKKQVFDLRSGGLYKEFKGHGDIIHALKFDNNSEILCSGGLDKTLKFWDVHLKSSAGHQLLLFGEDPLNSSKSSSKLSSGAASSIELLRSMNVDFHVYSIECDVQNVFYFTGALKQSFRSATHLKQTRADESLPVAVTQLAPKQATISDSVTLEKKLSLDQPKSRVRPRATSRKSSLSGTSLTSTATSSVASMTLNSSASTSKSPINTRRRTALISNTSSLSSNMPHSAPPPPNSFLFNNDDDLYEV